MNFLRNLTLRQSGAILLVLIASVYCIEYLVINALSSRIDEAEHKIEFTQSALGANQNISLLLQQYLNGNTSAAPEISSLLTEQEYRFKVLAQGGRVDESEFEIGPLSRLSRITLEGLKDSWQDYKQSILTLMAQESPIEPVPEATIEPRQEDDSTQVSFSIVASAPLPGPSYSATQRIHYEGLSLNLFKWYDKLVKDVKEDLDTRKDNLSAWRTLFLLLNILLLGLLFYLFFKYVIQPLYLLKNNIEQLRHTYDVKMPEFAEVAEQINNTVENLKDATDFVTAIGQGDLKLNYKETLDEHYTPGNNRLADSLIEMQAKLLALSEEEQKRQWTNEGIAKFVEIMRTSHDNLSALGDRIISGLAHYTKSNQGGLYFLNEEDPNNVHLELISLFAFDIKKHEQQKIKPGQGILGQAFLEKDTTYLTELPSEYIRITSGLGGANPKAVLIVPLKLDRDIYGLVELASFNEYAPHEISFVEKLGETIASTLASVKAAQKNKQLIEQFQQQTEQMRAQEEEMRQNMEELQATQEEVVRKEKNYIDKIHELESSLSSLQDNSNTAGSEEKWKEKEGEHLIRIQKLEAELSKKPDHEKEWIVAAEVHKALQINLEAIRITQTELNIKSSD